MSTDTQTPQEAPKREQTENRAASSRRPSGRPGAKRFVRRSERPRPEFEQKILAIRRVARVVAGGRRFSFSVTVAIGDQKGSLGIGLGKASDTALAIEKAVGDAKKHMITIPRTESNSIEHEVSAKYCASHVLLRPSPGRGLVAGGTVRNVLQLAGITGVVGKLLSRSGNTLNNAHATMGALAKLPGVKPYEKKTPSANRA